MGRGIFYKFPLKKEGQGDIQIPPYQRGQGDIPHRAEALCCYESLICNMWLQPSAIEESHCRDTIYGVSTYCNRWFEPSAY